MIFIYYCYYLLLFIEDFIKQAPRLTSEFLDIYCGHFIWQTKRTPTHTQTYTIDSKLASGSQDKHVKHFYINNNIHITFNNKHDKTFSTPFFLSALNSSQSNVRSDAARREVVGI